MSIGFQNEVGHCVRNPDAETGHWYRHTDGRLYIVPTDGKIEGPDDQTLEELESAYRRLGFESVCPLTLASELGLDVVHPWQQRFDVRHGYFAT